MIKNIQLILFFWLVLLFALLPISYRLLPEIGKLLSTLLLPVNELMCAMLFNISIQKTFLISDSAAYYSGAILLFVLSVVLVISTSSLQLNFNKVKQILFLMLCYILAYFLIRYGFDKILGNQFYFPASNTLHTPVGYLSKDILFWSTMGTSSFYNHFMAFTEIVAGLLLLWKPTRFLGLIVSFGLLSNVFATNIGFDITVKYLSGLLLLTTLVCITFFVREIKQLVGIQSNSIAPPEIILTKRNKLIFKSFVLVVLFIDVVIPYFQAGSYPFESKSYLVTEYTDSNVISNLKNAKRIHFHREGYLVTETYDQQFKSHVIRKSAHGFRLNNLNFAINEDNTIISWNEKGQINELKVKEIMLDEMPLSKDESHWCVEEMIGK